MPRYEIEADEPDEYDETGEVKDPSSPIWEDSDMQDAREDIDLSEIGSDDVDDADPNHEESKTPAD